MKTKELTMESVLRHILKEQLELGVQGDAEYIRMIETALESAQETTEKPIFSLGGEDVQCVAMEKLDRKLTEEEMETFTRKFTIEDWWEHIECHLDCMELENAEKDKL